MISGVLLIFGLPLILAAILISPTGLHDLLHGVPLAAIIIGILLPFAAWPIFLSTLALPPSGSSRIAALVKLWVGGTVMATAVINLLVAMAMKAIRASGARPSDRINHESGN